MTDKLLPCPFCAKRLERNADFSNRHRDHYNHPVLDDDEEPCILSHINVVNYLDSRHNAGSGNVDRWNRRDFSPMTIVAGVVAEIATSPAANDQVRGTHDS